jgi:hypothetical protein
MAIYLDFARLINCTFKDVKCLMKKSVDEILIAQMAVEKKVTSLKLLIFFEPWLPWVDGKLVRGQLLDLPKWNLPESFIIKPFTLGSLREECVIYIYSSFLKPMSTLSYSELLAGMFKQDAPSVLAQYPPVPSSNDQRNVTTVLATNFVFSCPTRRFIEQALNWNTKSASNNKYFHYIFDFPLDFNGIYFYWFIFYSYYVRLFDCIYVFR